MCVCVLCVYFVNEKFFAVCLLMLWWLLLLDYTVTHSTRSYVWFLLDYCLLFNFQCNKYSVVWTVLKTEIVLFIISSIFIVDREFELLNFDSFLYYCDVNEQQKSDSYKGESHCIEMPNYATVQLLNLHVLMFNVKLSFVNKYHETFFCSVKL